MTKSCTPTPRPSGRAAPTWPGPTDPRDAAVARQNAAIETCIRDALRRASGDGGNADPKVPPLLVTGSQGTGKTTAALRAILDANWTQAAGWTVWFMVPTVEKAEEARRELFGLALDRTGGLPSLVIKGRGARVSRTGPETMCARAQAAARVGEAGLPVGRVLCKSADGAECRLLRGCDYQMQQTRLRKFTGGVVFLAHEYAWLGLPGPKPDLVIIDESVVAKATWSATIPVRRLVDGPVRSEVADLDWSMGSWFAECLGHPDNLKQVRAHFGRDALVGMREALAGLKGASVDLSPDLADEEVVARLDARPRDGRAGLIRLLDAILAEYDMPRDSFNAVWTETRRIDGKEELVLRCGGLKGLTLPEKAAVLLLDGTGDPELNRRIFGEVRHLHVPVPRDAYVEQVINSKFSRQSLTGQTGTGVPISERATTAAAALRVDVRALVDRQPGPVFVGTYKAVAEVIAQDLVGAGRTDVLVGQFGALRGINRFSGCITAVVLGRQQPAPASVEAEARPFLATDPDALIPVGRYALEKRFVRMRSGGVRPVDVEVHPDRRVQRTLEQIREAEMLQTIDRVRAIFNHRRIIVLSSVVLDITADRAVSWAEMKEGGNRFMRIWDGHGLLPLSAKHLAALPASPFPSAEAAKKALQEARRTASAFGEESLIESLIGTAPPHLHVRYKCRGARGCNARAEAFVSTGHLDPRRALEAVTGPLDAFEVLDAAPEVMAMAAE